MFKQFCFSAKKEGELEGSIQIISLNIKRIELQPVLHRLLLS